MFNITNRKSAIFMALIVLLSAGAAGFAMAAAPTVDTETSETSQSSDITDGSSQTYNDTTTSDLSWSADSKNSSVVIEQDNRTLYSGAPDPYYTNSTTGTSYYNVSLNDDAADYDGIEAGAGENATLNVTFYNNTEVDNPDTTNISYTYVNGEEKAFAATEDPVGEQSSDGFLSSLNILSDDEDVGPQQSTDAVRVTNNTSSVEIATVDTNMTDAFTSAAEDEDAGELLWNVHLQSGDAFVPVFYKEAGDQSWLDTDEDAYATVSSDGSTLTIHNAHDLLDDGQTETLELTATGDEMIGFDNARTMLQNYGATGLDAIPFGAVDLNGQPDWADA